MDALKLKIPPPVIALLCLGMIWLIARVAPGFSFVFRSSRMLAGYFAIVGLLISLSAVVGFRRAGTTVLPHKPERASALVTSGIYRFTRNPMYLGLGFLLLAWAIFLSNALAFVVVPMFILYMNVFQIGPEEAALANVFGQDYLHYKTRVRRWL